jgi:NAD(P)-dependent dehydrogenase (short-subunit alcohol dehydrogenase family)
MPKHKTTLREPMLSGRLALITGANHGIGLAIARALARE